MDPEPGSERASRSPSPDRIDEAVALLARVERASPVLRRLRREPGHLVVSGPAVMRAGAEVEQLSFRVPAGGWQHAPQREPIAADALLMGSVPSLRLRLRLRAFYLDAGVTVSIHRVSALGRSTLLRGSKVAERFGGSRTFVIPRQLERSRKLSHAWVIEELLVRGSRATRREWPHLVREVATGIGGLWLRSESRTRSIRGVVPWWSGKEMSVLLRAMALEPGEPERLLRRVAAWLDADLGEPGRVLADAGSRRGVSKAERQSARPARAPVEGSD